MTNVNYGHCVPTVVDLKHDTVDPNAKAPAWTPNQLTATPWPRAVSQISDRVL